MIKRVLVVLMACVFALALFAGCGNGSSSSSAPAASGSSQPAGSASAAPEPGSEAGGNAGEGIKVALIASSSGMGDRSFNDAAWAGFEQAAAELGVEIRNIEPKSPADYVTSATTLANGGYQLIFAVGNDWGDTITEVAPQFPDVMWVGLNYDVDAPNVAIAKTADHEVGFLAGALAATMSANDTVGFIGGKDVPSINRFEVGYEEGARYISDSVNYLSTYVGAFDDPVKGKEFALQLIGQGADVIFHASGKSGEGLFEAIRENEDVYAIGVDSNQDYIVEGKVLTTAEKRLDVIAYDMIESLVNGTFTGGNKVYDLANGGVSLTDFEYTRDLIGEDTIALLDDLKAKIISGEIEVTDIFAQ